MRSYRFAAARLPLLPLALLAGVTTFVAPSPSFAQADAAETTSAVPPRFAVTDDASYAKYNQSYNELLGADPKRALRWLDTLLKEQSQIPPQFHRLMVMNLGEATFTYGGRDLDKTLAIYDGELATLSPDETDALKQAGIYLMASRANILRAASKPADAAKALGTQWPSITKGVAKADHNGRMAVGYAAEMYASSLIDAGRHTDNAAMLNKLLKAAPWFLVNGFNQADPLVAKLSLSLMKSGKPDEALGWAKLRYMTCDFKPDEIAGATKLLGQLWARKDDFDSIGAFSRAQQVPDAAASADGKDAAPVNPLVKVDLPTTNADWQTALAKQIAAVDKDMTRPPLQKRHDMTSLMIARGTKENMASAMALAKQTLREDPESAEGAREVCRVFKAADLNTIRANQFIDYLNGKAKSPFTSFNKEYPAPTAAN